VLVAFVGGMVAGLVIASVVAVTITNAPVPFVNKVERPARTVQSGANGALPDPNAALYSNPVSPEAQVEAETQEITKVEPGTSVWVPQPVLAPPEAPPVLSQGTRFMLQAGAFKDANEADSMRARLAMLGIDAKIYPVDQSDVTLYRVRMGPYGQVDEVSKALRLLTENEIEAQIVRVR